MELEEIQKRKLEIISNASKEMEKLRLFIKHLSYVNKHSSDNYNITKSVIKEIDSFKMDNNIYSKNKTESSSICYNHIKDKDTLEYAKQNVILYKSVSKEIDYLKNVVHEISDQIMKRYQIQKLKEYRPFRHYWDEKQFEDIFMASLSMNLPFNIHYTIALYAVGTIVKCYNPHKIDKELLILHETEHKRWFKVDYPENAICCSRCFRKYVKQCDGCGQVVLSNTINSLSMDGKWYCATTIKCIFGFGDDYRHP